MLHPVLGSGVRCKESSPLRPKGNTTNRAGAHDLHPLWHRGLLTVNCQNLLLQNSLCRNYFTTLAKPLFMAQQTFMKGNGQK